MCDHATGADDASTYLDAPESAVGWSPPPLDPDPIAGVLADTWRHTGWADARRRVHLALVRTGQSLSRITAFDNCGSAAYVVRSVDDPDRYRIVGSGCHDRFCMPCARERSRIVATNVVAYLDRAPVRFATLTLRHSTAPLRDQLSHLIASFRRLRQSVIWRRHVTGGLACLEITRGSDDCWHPHLHVLMQGRYLSHSELRSAWFAATGTSTIVDIRMARGDAEVVKYVTKYASKPYDGEITRRPDLLDELITAMYQVKTLITFGDWRDLSTTAVTTEGAWEYVCSLADLVRRAAAMEHDALAVLAQLVGDRLTTLTDLVPDDDADLPPPLPAPTPRLCRPDPQAAWSFALPPQPDLG